MSRAGAGGVRTKTRAFVAAVGLLLTVLLSEACTAAADEDPEAPEVTDCEVPHNETRANQCLFINDEANNCVITSIFPYLEAYYCWGGGQDWMKALVMTGYIIWCMLLFVVLATTADDYFAPSLTTLSEWMGLRERVAGLTFLALGNGAADMFSVIAAVRVGATDLAVGALQGGSMCVTCVVTAGVLMVVRGGNVKASGVFFTDIFVNIVSCIAVFIILNKGYTTFWEGLALLGLYTVYVFGVSLVGHGWIPPMLEKDRAAWRLKKEAEADLQEHLAAHRKSFGDVAATMGVVGPRESSYRPDEKAVPDEPIFDEPNIPPPSLPQSDAVVGDETLGDALLGTPLKDRRSFSYRFRNHATESMGSSWDQKDTMGRIMYAFEAVVHLLRAITTPVTPKDNELRGQNWNRGFQRLRASVNPPFFGAFLAFWVLRRMHDEQYLEYMKPFPWGNPPLLAFCAGLPVGFVVWVLTAKQMPAWLRNIYVIPSFIAAVLWFDIYAVELVECLRTFGYILDIPISLLGVTILAWGNSIGDFFADRAVARDGYIRMAISGCYGEPNFPRLIGLGLGIIFVTIPTDGSSLGDRYTKGVQLDTLNVIGFGFQWAVLVAVPVVAVLSGLQLKGSVLVPLLMLIYSAFLATSVACVYYEW